MEGFILHASNRLENLAELLAEVLKSPPDPMQQETILVQSGGMQRWVSMQLARRHGVCAGARFPFPVAFAYELCRELLADLPPEYPLSQERMLWRIVHLLRGLLHEPEFAPLARYVREDSELKSVQLAERIAYHFDQYLIFRPQWAARWERHEPSGNFVLPGHVTSEAWQARLWRELVRDMGGEHRAALLQRAIARLEKGVSLPRLPARVCVFGIPTLPPVYLDLLQALSRHRPVHVFLLSPCRQYWGDLLTHREQRRAYRSQFLSLEERFEDATPLAGLGAVGRDFLELLLDRDIQESEEDRYEEPDTTTMLGQLQADLLDGVGRVAVMQEITHLKELDRLKSEFVSTVSHDLRTPLTTIQGYVELLDRAGPLNDMQTKFIGKALSSLSHITALISDLLDIGRIEAGYDLEMQPLRMDELIRLATEAAGVIAATQDIDVSLELPQAPLWVWGNTRRLRQVLDNLISNALKYNRSGGRVRVSGRRDGDHVVVQVSDTGIGVPAEEQPRLFERFYRVQTPETEGIKGTGLGLAIVKSVIEKHRGRVWVESIPGQGSTFAFLLPIYSQQG